MMQKVLPGSAGHDLPNMVSYASPLPQQIHYRRAAPAATGPLGTARRDDLAGGILYGREKIARRRVRSFPLLESGYCFALSPGTRRWREVKETERRFGCRRILHFHSHGITRGEALLGEYRKSTEL